MLFLVASIMATTIFEIVKSAFNKTLNDDFGIESTVGSKSLSLTWIGTAFAVAAGLFWTLSICCCSGRSPYHYKDKEGGGFGGMGMPGRGKGRTKAERVRSPRFEWLVWVDANTRIDAVYLRTSRIALPWSK